MPEKRKNSRTRRTSESDGDDEEEHEAKRFLRELHSDQRMASSSPKLESEYKAQHIEGTSDPAERLLNFCKRVMTDSRKHMGPEMLSAVCCLSTSRSLRAAAESMPARTLHEVLQEEKRKQEKEEQERKRKEEQDQQQADSRDESDLDMEEEEY